jgi:hypothetical protein
MASTSYGGQARPDFGSLLASSTSLLVAPAMGRAGVDHATDSAVRASGATTAPSPSISDAAAPSLMKSLDQLSAASAALASTSITGVVGGGFMDGIGRDSSGASTYAAEASAYRLLAREGGGFDAASLGKSTRELEYKLQKSQSHHRQGAPHEHQHGGDAPSSAMPKDLDTFLQQNLQNMIKTSLSQSMDLAMRSSTEMMQKRMDEMYKQEKKHYMAELAGYRIVQKPNDGFASQPLPAFHQPPLSAPKMFGSCTTITDGSDSGLETGPALEELPRRHAALVCKLNSMEEASPSSSSALTFLTNLERLSRESAASQSRVSSDAEKYGAYANALGLFHSMLGDDETTSYPSPLSRAVGALKYLTTQYQSHVSQVAREAVGAGRITQTSSNTDSTLSATAQDVAWYVDSAMGIGSNSSNVLWPRLYHCEFM